MRRRPFAKFRPALERFEDRQLPSASPLAAHAATVAAHARAAASGDATSAKHLPTGFLGFRVTNPSHNVPYHLVPPFKQVLVQTNQPIPGQVYNVLQVAVKNGTIQTFTAANNFTVRLNTDQKDVFPVLTGNEQWKPRQTIVFYILTKKYYPIPTGLWRIPVEPRWQIVDACSRTFCHLSATQVRSGHDCQIARHHRGRRPG